MGHPKWQKMNAAPSRRGGDYRLWDPVSFPQPVKAAIFICSHYDAARREDKDGGRFITGLQGVALASFFCFQQDPLDKMSFQHGMFHPPYSDGNGLSPLRVPRTHAFRPHRPRDWEQLFSKV